MKKTILKSSLLAIAGLGILAASANAAAIATGGWEEYEYYQDLSVDGNGWKGDILEEGDSRNFYFDLAFTNDILDNPWLPSGTNSSLSLENDVEGYGFVADPMSVITDVWASVTLFSIDDEYDYADLDITAFYGNISIELSAGGNINQYANTQTFTFQFSSDLFDAWSYDPYGSIVLSVNGAGNDFGLVEVGMGVSDVPEPSTMLLFGTGLAGLAGLRRKKNQKKA